MHRKAGKFVTIEGTEGVGKSTNLAHVADEIRARGIAVFTTREPGGTEIAEQIRQLLLAVRTEKVHENTELLLIFAARAQHVQAVIEPKLAAGTWVVCDRFTDASYAYQGGGREMSVDTIGTLEQLVHPNLQPDLTLYLDLDWQQASARIADRQLDRFEQEKQAFFDRVRAAYLDRAANHTRFRVIDAAASLEDVQQALSIQVDEFLANLVE